MTTLTTSGDAPPPYGWTDSTPTHAHAYLMPAVEAVLAPLGKGLQIVDLGCGNGALAGILAQSGHRVVGVDVSPDGIEIARRRYPGLDFRVGSVYDEGLAERLPQADVVVSLEVVEHLLYPRKLFSTAARTLRPGGTLIASTPYHGYLKNVAISLANGWDKHFTVGWDGGHVKFFSKATLRSMAAEAGFVEPRFRGAGRMPWLWKSMILVARAPRVGARIP